MSHQNKSNLSVDVKYPWTGTFIDTMIENTLGAKSGSSGCGCSGCGCGERDMQFILSDTPEVRQRIDLLKRQQGIKVTVKAL